MDRNTRFAKGKNYNRIEEELKGTGDVGQAGKVKR
jgi:hypothetical protein